MNKVYKYFPVINPSPDAYNQSVTFLFDHLITYPPTLCMPPYDWTKI